MLLRPSALLWLWVLPVAVLLALNVQGYWLVEGNMDGAQRGRAHLLGLAGLADLLIAAGVYFAGRRRMAREGSAGDGVLPVWWAVPAIAAQAGYLWMALAWGESRILPRSVTAWIYTPERFFYNQFAFAMVPLFWGLLRLACARADKGRGRALIASLAAAVAAPVLLYAMFQMLRRTGRHFDFSPYVFAALIIVLSVLMFVAIIRGIALGLRNVDAWSGPAERIAIVIFALVLPLGGLALNREIPFPNDFQAWEVYALTTANAAILLLASWCHGRRPLLSFGLLCATLPFSLYFFVVFLPFLPLSILAVIALGAGFLVLAPTVLLILHLSLLNKARRGPDRKRLAVGALCFLLLPGFFTVRGLADKAALNAALDHVYAPVIGDGPVTFGSSLANLRRALANHRRYKDGIYYPLLSDYYAWLVFDNLVLPDDKLARLEETFFGKADGTKQTSAGRGGARGSGNRGRNRMPRANPPPRTVEVENIAVSTKPAGDGATLATVKLTLRNTGVINAEYVEKLPLPAGVCVGGFRLRVDGRPVPGRITEKKTALWVYTMIRDSERRDPGLLFYDAPDELELRVFPVAAGTTSEVEIDFLAPANTAKLEGLDGGKDPARFLRRMGEVLPVVLSPVESGTVMAGGAEAFALPAAKRETYLHVIVDRSADNGFDGDLAAAIAALEERFPSVHAPRITLANFETFDLPAGSREAGLLPRRGGFAADLALAHAIRQHAGRDLDAVTDGENPAPRPVFVILGRRSGEKPPKLDVAESWKDLLPALEVYEMDEQKRITPLESGAIADAPLLRLGRSVRPWLKGKAIRFGAADENASPEYWSPEKQAWRPVDGVNVLSRDGPWGRAMALQAAQQDHERSPGGARADLKALVAASRESGVMVAATSYIVVENAAQWRMLDVAERRKLDQNAALAFKEAPAPWWVWTAAGFGMWTFFRRRRAAPPPSLP